MRSNSRPGSKPSAVPEILRQPSAAIPVSGEQDGTAMAGIGQDKAAGPARTPRTRKVTNMPGRIVRRKFIVQPREDSFRLGDFSRASNRGEADRAHHEHRGRDAFAGNVAQKHHQPLRPRGAHAVEVAAHFARRLEHRAESDAIRLFHAREVVRQHAHLNFARDAQFAGDLLLHRVAVSLGLEQRRTRAFTSSISNGLVR